MKELLKKPGEVDGGNCVTAPVTGSASHIILLLGGTKRVVYKPGCALQLMQGARSENRMIKREQYVILPFNTLDVVS